VGAVIFNVGDCMRCEGDFVIYEIWGAVFAG